VTTEPGLRERRREETLAAIRAAAQNQLVSHGAAALSLRAVAREVGMAVSALYRYYGSRDELLTELVIAAFTAQADAVEKALRSESDPVAALGAALWAYRTWSVEHPAEFGLLYGAPVPGYEAPASTSPAAARVGDLLAAAVQELHAVGLVDEAGAQRRARRLDRATRAEFGRSARHRGHDLPEPVIALLVDGFVRLHGVVVMEVFGQLRPLTDRPGDYAACLLDGLLADLLGDRGTEQGGQTAATTSSSTTRSRNASTEASR
jgi:AcrR family transcriptional regulator